MSIKVKQHECENDEVMYEINIREGDQIILNGRHVVLHATDQNLMDGFDDDESEVYKDYSHELCFVEFKDQSFVKNVRGNDNDDSDEEE